MLLALLWKRSNKLGAIAGMSAGAVIIFVWKFGISTLGGGWAIYELLPAFLCALVANVLVSLLTGEPERAVLQQFDRMQG